MSRKAGVEGEEDDIITADTQVLLGVKANQRKQPGGLEITLVCFLYVCVKHGVCWRNKHIFGVSSLKGLFMEDVA